MNRNAFAVWTVLAGLLAGVIGLWLLYGQPFMDLSFPLFILALFGVLATGLPYAGLPLNWRKLWPIIPLLFFAAMIAVRADPLVVMLNVLMVGGIGALLLHYLPEEKALDQAPLAEHFVGLVAASSSALVMAPAQWVDSWNWVKQYEWRQRGVVVGVVRGAAITVPVVVVFGALLASADAVFATYVDGLWQVMTLRQIDTLFTQTIFVGMVAWAVTGLLAYTLGRPIYYALSDEDKTETAAEGEGAETDGESGVEEKRKPATLHLGIIEAGMLLGSLTFLFAVFVGVQFTYFFGGERNITAAGFTYAEYARRGFFELLTVSILTLGVVRLTDHLTVRRHQGHHRVFQGLTVVITLLMLVMLVSASQRMTLYEEAFGFTHLRVYAHTFTLWLAVLFGFFVLTVFKVRQNVFTLGLVLVAIGYATTLNVMNVDQVIAERNIARYENGSDLDLCYLNALSVDAVPAMLELYEVTAEDPLQAQAHDFTTGWLVRKALETDERRQGGLLNFHYGYWRAEARLGPLEDELVIDGTSDGRCTRSYSRGQDQSG